MTIQINGTSGISGVDGSATTPALQGTDTNTGITFGTDEVNVVTGGSTRATVDSNGRLGVGTSSPSELLTLRSTGEPKIQIEDADLTNRIGQISQAGGAMIFRSQADTADGQFVFRGYGGGTDTERMKLTADGFLKASSNTADTGAYSTGGYHLLHNDTQNWTLVIDNSNALPYGILVDFSDAAPDNNSQSFFLGRDSATDRFRVWADGDCDNHDNSYGGFSDEKLKQDIVDAGSQWDDVKSLRVRKFKFKSDVELYGAEAKTLIGVVAQETELVSPGLVKTAIDFDDEGNDLGTTTKSVRYSVLYMKAVKALQEAMTRIEQLETRVAQLEGGAS